MNKKSKKEHVGGKNIQKRIRFPLVLFEALEYVQELEFKELNHLAVILHFYAGVLIFMK